MSWKTVFELWNELIKGNKCISGTHRGKSLELRDNFQTERSQEGVLDNSR